MSFFLFSQITYYFLFLSFFAPHSISSAVAKLQAKSLSYTKLKLMTFENFNLGQRDRAKLSFN